MIDTIYLFDDGIWCYAADLDDIGLDIDDAIMRIDIPADEDAIPCATRTLN